MTELEKAVAEWREARKAFFAVSAVPAKERFPAEVWKRLGHAEHRLMQIAEAILSDG